ncbi:unnamed protein product [Eretmochelys imbricata]
MDSATGVCQEQCESKRCVRTLYSRDCISAPPRGSDPTFAPKILPLALMRQPFFMAICACVWTSEHFETQALDMQGWLPLQYDMAKGTHDKDPGGDGLDSNELPPQLSPPRSLDACSRTDGETEVGEIERRPQRG